MNGKSQLESQIFFGRNILREALLAGVIPDEIYFENDAAQKYLVSLRELKNLRVPLVSRFPKSAAGESHQGIAFSTRHQFYKNYSQDRILNSGLVMICDGVQDIHNFGSIVRCGAAFGSKVLIHSSHGSARLTAAAVKSSAGLAFRTSFFEVEELTNVLKDMTQAGVEIVGLDSGKHSSSLFDWVPRFPLAMIFGNEGEGLSSKSKKYCQGLLRIPMENLVDSLNVSHAAGIAMAWAYRSYKIDAF